MGAELVKALRDTPGARLAAAIDRPGSRALGSSLDGVSVVDSLAAVATGLDAVIDFSSASAVAATADACAAAGVPLMVGTTGIDAAAHARLDAAAANIP